MQSKKILLAVAMVLSLGSFTACTEISKNASKREPANAGPSLITTKYNTNAVVHVPSTNTAQTIALNQGDLNGTVITLPLGSLADNTDIQVNIVTISPTAHELTITANHDLQAPITITFPSIMTKVTALDQQNFCYVTFRKPNSTVVDPSWKPLTSCDAGAQIATWGTLAAEWIAASANDLTITVPASGAMLRRGSDGVTLTMSGTCLRDGLSITLLVDDAPASAVATCLAGAWSGAVTVSGIAASTHTFAAKGSLYGQTFGSAGPVSFTAGYTGNKPTLAITTPASDGTTVNASQAAAVSYSGTCSEVGRNVVITGAISAQTTCQSGGTWSLVADLSSVADNTAVTITANHANQYGFAATAARRSVNKYTTSPNTATGLSWNQGVTYSSGLVVNTTSISARWTAPTSTNIASQSLQLYADASCGVSSGSVVALSAVAISKSLTGTNNINYSYRITSTDNFGQTAVSACSTSMLVDTQAPSISITTQPDPMTKPSDIQTIGVSVGDLSTGIATLTWAYAENGTSWGAETALATSATSFTHTIPAGANSSIAAKYRVTATDGAGNTSQVTTNAFQILTQTNLLINQGQSALGMADGAATQARFGSLQSIATDGTYLYVMDQNVLRRVSLSDGTTDTIAGKWGMQGSTDGVGPAARFGVTFSGLGMTVLGDYLYITESGYQTIRSVNINPLSAAFKTVAIIAGASGTSGSTDATGTSARFNTPTGITNDGTYLYVADYGNHVIRKIDIATNAVTTVAGLAGTPAYVNATGTAARFQNPLRIVYDAGSTSFYITDAGTRTIRKMTTGYVVTTLFNTGPFTGIVDGTAATGSASRPVGITTDGTNLYFCDVKGNVIRSTSISTGTTTTIYGLLYHADFANGNAAAAMFNTPLDVVYAGGNLYVADAGNFSIRKIDLTGGTVSQFAGAPIGSTGFDPHINMQNSSIARFDQNYDITTTDGTNLYVPEFLEHTIRAIDLTAGTSSIIAGSSGIHGSTDANGTSARFRNPYSVIKVGTALYVSDGGNQVIRKIDLASGNAVTTIAGTVGSTGTTDNATGTSALFSTPRGIASDGTYIYVADYGNNRIRRITIGGSWPVTTIAGNTSGYNDATGTSALFRAPTNLTVNGTTLYISDYSNFNIRAINLSNNAVTTLAGSTAGVSGFVDATGSSARFGNGLRGLTYASGFLYVADSGNGRIRAIDVATGATTTVAGGGSSNIPVGGAAYGAQAQLSNGVGLASNGSNLFISSVETGTIKRFNTSTKLVEVVAGSASNGIANPVAVTSTNEGALNETFANRISMGISDGAYLYLVDQENYVIRRTNLDGSNNTIVIGSSGKPGYVDAAGTTARIGYLRGNLAYNAGYVYFSDYSGGTVRRFDTSSFTVETIAGTAGTFGTSDGTGAAASFSLPAGVTIVGTDLYVGDSGNHTIRKISIAPGTFGVTTTYAGQTATAGTANGIGTAATFSAPFALTSLGNMLYIADNGNSMVRQIDLITGSVSYLAGTSGCADVDATGTAAMFCGLNSIFTDGSKYAYVGETYSGSLRRIRLSDGQTTTFIGKLGYVKSDPAGSVLTTYLPQSAFFYVPGVGIYYTAKPSFGLIK